MKDSLAGFVRGSDEEISAVGRIEEDILLEGYLFVANSIYFKYLCFLRAIGIAMPKIFRDRLHTLGRFLFD